MVLFRAGVTRCACCLPHKGAINLAAPKASVRAPIFVPNEVQVKGKG